LVDCWNRGSWTTSLWATADTLLDRDAQANLEWAAHELESERVNDDFARLPFAGGAEIDWSDDASLVAQLFFKHPFYKNRFDLVRQFKIFLIQLANY